MSANNTTVKSCLNFIALVIVVAFIGCPGGVNESVNERVNERVN